MVNLCFFMFLFTYRKNRNLFSKKFKKVFKSNPHDKREMLWGNLSERQSINSFAMGRESERKNEREKIEREGERERERKKRRVGERDRKRI